MVEQSRPLLVLVDGHAVAYRAFYALSGGNFATRSGEPTNATYGFTRVILDILEEGPAYFAVSFDRGLSGRDEIYSDYKGTREKMPDELAIQMERIEQVVRAFNIPVLALDGYEADDVIGTITHQAEAEGCEIRIVTGDRDLLQLVTEHTRVQLPQRGKPDQIYTPQDFTEKYPLLQPEQLPDMKGLMGDSSDNIPGVKGVGEKTALKLLQAYGTLDNIYEHINEQKGALRKKLENDRELAFLSRKLATIQREVPIELVLTDCVTHDYDAVTVETLFRELEFRTFSRRLRELNPDLPETLIEAADEEKKQEIEPVESILVNTEKALNDLVEKLNAASWICFDVESTGLDQMQTYLVGLSLSVDGTTGYYIPLGHIPPGSPDEAWGGILPDGQPVESPDGPVQGDMFAETENMIPQLAWTTVREAITPALTNLDIPKIAHNAKFDLVIMRRYGIDVQPIAFDTMIAEWVRDPASNNLGLKNLALIELGYEMKQIEELIGSGKKQISFAKVPIAEAVKYAGADTAIPLRLREMLTEKIAENNASDLFEKLEMPLVPVIADMEMQGVLVNVEYLHKLSGILSTQIAEVEREIHTLANYGEFNINSLNQLSTVLFEHLKLPTEGLRKTKTGNYSLTADVLDSLADTHAIIPLVLQYRSLNKLLNTYVDALPELVNPQTGRIHTSYNQTGTSTGRFSSSDPNLQNIPIRTEEGRRIRKAFIAPEGHVLLSVDYSQVELRILAHYSDDESLLEAFRQEQDIHATTAAAVHQIPLEDVSYEQRSFAKSVNFGLMYGMGAFRLARDSSLTHAQAKKFIDDYFERFPGVKSYLDGSKEFAHTHGYVETLFKRRRQFRELQDGRVKGTARQRAEREAINMPVQGTAADILKQAMLDLHRALREKGYRSRMILQVHDELVLEVPEDELDAVTALVKEVMESAFELKAPLKAEARVGKNWQEMQDI